LSEGCGPRGTSSTLERVAGASSSQTFAPELVVDALEGQALTTAASYIRFARTTSVLDDEELFLEYPQLEDCIVPDDPDPVRVARELAGMTRRHAGEVLEVVERKVEYAVRFLVLGELPETCVTRLAISRKGDREPPKLPAVTLSADELAEFEKARFSGRLRTELTGRTSGRKSNIVLIETRELEFPDAEFLFFLRLCVAVCEEPDAWVTVRRLDEDGTVTIDAVDRELLRLRTRVAGALPPGLSRLQFLQRARGKVRLSTHRRFIAWDRATFLSHPNEAISKLAERLQACA
jgi:hypothetical protein